MRLDRKKCYCMVLGDQSNDLTVQIETIPVFESREQKLQVITVNRKLTFKTDIESLCRKANQKLHALSVLRAF